MDKVEVTAALIPNVTLKYQACDVTNNKTKHKSLTNAKNRIIIYLQPLS